MKMSFAIPFLAVVALALVPTCPLAEAAGLGRVPGATDGASHVGTRLTISRSPNGSIRSIRIEPTSADVRRSGEGDGLREFGVDTAAVAAWLTAILPTAMLGKHVADFSFESGRNSVETTMFSNATVSRTYHGSRLMQLTIEWSE